jgi:hypothetical protein
MEALLELAQFLAAVAELEMWVLEYWLGLWMYLPLL